MYRGFILLGSVGTGVLNLHIKDYLYITPLLAFVFSLVLIMSFVSKETRRNELITRGHTNIYYLYYTHTHAHMHTHTHTSIFYKVAMDITYASTNK